MIDDKFKMFLSFNERKKPKEILRTPDGVSTELPFFGLINILISEWPMDNRCTPEEEYEALYRVYQRLGIDSKNCYENIVYGYYVDDKPDVVESNDFSQHITRMLNLDDDEDDDGDVIFEGVNLLIDCENDNPVAPDNISFTQELKELVQATNEWLNVKNKIKPIQSYSQAASFYYDKQPLNDPAVTFGKAHLLKPDIEINPAFGERHTRTKVDIIERKAIPWVRFDVLNRRYKTVVSRLYLGDDRKESTIRSVDTFAQKETSIQKVKEIRNIPFFCEIYSANNLFSLAWMELLWAVKNNVYASVCTNCGQLYPITNKQKDSFEYCLPQCKVGLRVMNKELAKLKKARNLCYQHKKRAKDRDDPDSFNKYKEENEDLSKQITKIETQIKKTSILGIPWR